MEPTIYKPGTHKTPGVYKGSGGIYNGRGVYNDGAGGGSPFPPGYTRYDFIEYVVDTTGVNDRTFSLPVNVDTNEDLEIYLTYKEPIFDSGSSYLLKWNNIKNLPSTDKIDFLQRYNGSMYHAKNGGALAWNTNLPTKFKDQKATIKIKNGDLFDGDDDSLIASIPTMYGVFSMLNSYLYPFGAGTNTKLNAKRYELKGVKNGFTLFDFVPVVEDATSEPGFFDLVNNLFVKPDDSSYHNYAAGNDT